MRGVVTAGDALQFREFVDHARLQVVLRKFRRAARERGIDTDLAGDRLRQRGHARDLVGHAAQLGLVGHGREARAHRIEALLQVFVEEELGVGEARADDAFVALADFRRILGLDIGNPDEVLGELAAGVEHREEFLVGLHGRDQCFLRYGKELAFEGARHRDWPFVEAVHLGQVVRVDARAAAQGFRRGFDFGDDARAALVRINQHLGVAQCADVIARRGDGDGGGMMEAMPARVSAGADAQCFELHDAIAEQRDQPVQRPREAMSVRTPAHRLGDRHRGQRFVQHGLQQVGGARARGHRAVHEALALGIGRLLQRVTGNTRLGGEAFERTRRFACCIQRDVEVRTQYFAALFGLLVGHLREQYRKTSRRIQRLRIAALDGHAAPLQRSDHAIEKRLGQAGQRLDRQFLGAEFDQEWLHAHAAASSGSASSPSALRWPGSFKPGNPSVFRAASEASATACDSLRTRRM